MTCLRQRHTGRNPGFSLAENTDDLFVGKTLLHGSVLMLLMNILLSSGGMLINGEQVSVRRTESKNKTGSLPSNEF